MVEQLTRKQKVVAALVGSTPPHTVGQILVALFEKKFHLHIHKIYHS
jgi:hypothetical protein